MTIQVELNEALASRSVPQGNLTLEGFHAMLNAHFQMIPASVCRLFGSNRRILQSVCNHLT
jgi:hypothetical protein